MTATTIPICTHPILKRLHLSLPLQIDTGWTYRHMADSEENSVSLNITLGAGNDLIIEILTEAIVSARYVFDPLGELISAHRNGGSPDPLFTAFSERVVTRIQQQFPFGDHGREEPLVSSN